MASFAAWVPSGRRADDGGGRGDDLTDQAGGRRVAAPVDGVGDGALRRGPGRGDRLRVEVPPEDGNGRGVGRDLAVAAAEDVGRAVGVGPGDLTRGAGRDGGAEIALERQGDHADVIGPVGEGAAGRRRGEGVDSAGGAELQRTVAREKQDLFAEHQHFEADAGGDRADVVEALARVLGLEVDVVFDADALVGRGVVLRADGRDRTAVAAGDADADVAGVDAGDGAPGRLDAALAADARDLVTERRQDRVDELRAELEVVVGQAGRRRPGLAEGRLDGVGRELRRIDERLVELLDGRAGDQAGEEPACP